ncbi:MAG: signal peptidase I [Terriglobia bacterium]
MNEPPRKSSTRDTFESLVITVILAVFGTTFVVQAFKIPTGSMENTLLIGDHLLVNKFCFADQPGWMRRILPYRRINRGDVVVFKYPGIEPGQEPGTHFVKRVIGVPGDRIRIVNRQVYVNGSKVQEPYVRNTYPDEERPGDDFPLPPGQALPGSTTSWAETESADVKNGQVVVPPGEYFVMGDNRENSWDSRFWGFVPRDLVSGRPLLIYWSYEIPPGSYLLTSFSDRVSQLGSIFVHFFTKTRWRRTFKIVH